MKSWRDAHAAGISGVDAEEQGADGDAHAPAFGLAGVARLDETSDVSTHNVTKIQWRKGRGQGHFLVSAASAQKAATVRILLKISVLQSPAAA
jgi:hypothetical protein